MLSKNSLSSFLKTETYTGNTGNTGNDENTDQKKIINLYSENRKLQENTGNEKLPLSVEIKNHREESKITAPEMPEVSKHTSIDSQAMVSKETLVGKLPVSGIPDTGKSDPAPEENIASDPAGDPKKIESELTLTIATASTLASDPSTSVADRDLLTKLIEVVRSGGESDLLNLQIAIVTVYTKFDLTYKAEIWNGRTYREQANYLKTRAA